MRSSFFAFLASNLGILLLLVTARTAEPDERLAADEATLKRAGVGSDAATLLGFFRLRTLSDAMRAKIGDLIKQLGDDDFTVREKATRQLADLGPAAGPALLQAARDSDPEISSRAKKCLDSIQVGAQLDLAATAARVLADRKAPEAVKVLLAYLPSAADEWLEEEIAVVLAQLGVRRDGKPHAALVAAASDPAPARRLAAGISLARAAEAEYRAAARRLLQDTDPRVRLHTARALLAVRDRTAVPPLVALLEEGPPALAGQSEDLLFRIAGDRPPSVALDTSAPDRRRACRAAWEDWWRANEAHIKLADIDAEQRLLGLTIVCDCSVGGQSTVGRLWEFGSDGKTRWQIDGVRNPADVQVLPNGNLLIAECQGFQVSERDRQGKEVWAHRVKGYPVSCQRLSNGNTFIATYTELLEVTRDGKTLYAHPRPNSIYCAQKLRNGNILYIHSTGQLIEIDPAGKQLRSVQAGNTASWAGVEVLPSGRFLIAQYAANQVVELDEAGKELWKCTVQTPAWATRLRNGNTLVASPDANRIFEFDRSGKQVWVKQTQGRPFRVRRR